MSVITSHGNSAFKALHSAGKDKSMMLLEGRRIVMDALSRGMVPEMAAVTPRYREAHGEVDFPHITISEGLFARIADTKTPQGILALFPIPWAPLEKIIGHEKIIILDGLQDPGNVGTIIRTAEAFGFQAVAVTEETASPFSAKAVRSSMGSSLGVDIAKITKADAAGLPHRIVSLAPSGSSELTGDLFDGKCAICLGREGSGVSPEILAVSHATVSIPMKGDVESLNVSVAAGIVMAYAGGALGACTHKPKSFTDRES